MTGSESPIQYSGRQIINSNNIAETDSDDADAGKDANKTNSNNDYGVEATTMLSLI